MMLESMIPSGRSFHQQNLKSGTALTGRYPCHIDETIHVEDIVKGIVGDLKKGEEVSDIALKFHDTLILIIFETVSEICKREGIRKVVLSGGVFQNKYLLEGVESIMRSNNYQVYSHSAVPTNDGGIALGQMAVAAKRREMGCV
jgi:hydrogenase maturation protein HypF